MPHFLNNCLKRLFLMTYIFDCFQNKGGEWEWWNYRPPHPHSGSGCGLVTHSVSLPRAQAQFKSHGSCGRSAEGFGGVDWNFSLAVRTRNWLGECWAQKQFPGGGCRAFPSGCIRPKSSSKEFVGSMQCLSHEVGAIKLLFPKGLAPTLFSEAIVVRRVACWDS